jgi:hypothetical protein
MTEPEQGQTERRMMSELVRLQQVQGYTFYVEGILETDPEAVVSAMWDRRQVSSILTKS